jgi:hypothetical protein
MQRSARVAVLEARSGCRTADTLDPVAFAERAGITPDGWQRDVLRSTATQQLLNCSRQSGKSTVSAVIALHQALYVPESLVLVLSPSLRQSQELYRKVLDTYAAAGAPVPATVENRLALELSNGSRIVSLPGKEATVRGFSGVALLVVDEASRVPDELYAAIRPMLAVSRGRIIALSTPAGKRGWFFDAWTEGGEAWHRTLITAHDVPRIDPAWLEAERRSIPASVFEQEYACVFGEVDDAAFAHADIRAAVTPTIVPLFAQEAS